MQAEVLTLCDFTQESGGKLTIVGTFDTMLLNNIPSRFPSMYLAVRIRFNRGEAGQHNIKIVFLDPESKNVVPALEHKLMVEVPTDQSSAVTHLCLALQMVELKQVGQHSISLSVDSAKLCVLPLFVNQIKQVHSRNADA